MPRYVPMEFHVELLIKVDAVPRYLASDDLDYRRMRLLFGNPTYIELTDVTVADATAVQEREARYVRRIASSEDCLSTLEEVVEEACRDPDWLRFDIGVAGTIYALVAAGCLTGASCNGGAFGDWHHETHPLIVFLPPKRDMSFFVDVAVTVGAGLQFTPNGALLLYTDNIETMMAFGTEMTRRLSEKLAA